MNLRKLTASDGENVFSVFCEADSDSEAIVMWDPFQDLADSDAVPPTLRTGEAPATPYGHMIEIEKIHGHK